MIPSLPDPVMARVLCVSCWDKEGADGRRADARIVHVHGHKRPTIQHRQHCPCYDPTLKAEIQLHGLVTESQDWREALKP